MLVNEIFYSIQGEGVHTGVPAVFVRFSGCNLKCPFCDTDHSSGTEMTEEEIVKRVMEFPGDDGDNHRRRAVAAAHADFGG